VHLIEQFFRYAFFTVYCKTVNGNLKLHCELNGSMLFFFSPFLNSSYISVCNISVPESYPSYRSYTQDKLHHGHISLYYLPVHSVNLIILC